MDINPLFGKWQMVSYADNKQILLNVTIELKSERDSSGHYMITGKSPLNFYFSTFDIDDTNNLITVYDVQSTKIGGGALSVSFEKNYYELLTKIKSYEVSNSGKTLKLILPVIENQHITYKLIQ
jgi:heat shock protein HslJ